MSQFRIEIAGKTAQVDSLFDSTRDYCRSYLTASSADFAITVSPEELVLEQQLLLEEALQEGFRPKQFPDPFLERSVLLKKLSEQLLTYDTLLLHGSAIAVDGQGYLFSAKSGTGKSTHVRFWQQLLGQKAVTINDDKPFFRITQTEVFVCGSPWNGKHGLDSNITVPLKGICFLQRGSENRIWRLNSQEARLLLHANGCPPPDSAKRKRYLSLLDDLAARTALWGMECTKDPMAAHVSYEAMASK